MVGPRELRRKERNVLLLVGVDHAGRIDLLRTGGLNGDNASFVDDVLRSQDQAIGADAHPATMTTAGDRELVHAHAARCSSVLSFQIEHVDASECDDADRGQVGFGVGNSGRRRGAP